MPGERMDQSIAATGGREHLLDWDLPTNPANYAPLTPMTFLSRAAGVYPTRTAVIYGERRYDWRTFDERCRRLASALRDKGVGKGDVVSVLAPNIPEMAEAHFGVPLAGGVLNALNIRLDAPTIAFMLGHCEAKGLIVDREFAPLAAQALALMDGPRPWVVDIDDPMAAGGELIGEMDYEALLATGDPAWTGVPVTDEWQAISLNYPSGTTGDPKGVVYHHRGAYLSAMGNLMVWGATRHPVYLWTLPMFHCNGWCFPWAVAAVAGTHVCLRAVTADGIVSAIENDGVSHFCGAPTIMSMLLLSGRKPQTDGRVIEMMTAAAPPPAAIIEGMEGLGVRITHVYGLTEVYGPATICAPQDDWAGKDIAERAVLTSRQGVRYPTLDGMMVADAETLEPKPHDGTTIGEVMLRGNMVMKGYLKNPSATDRAFAGGWFHTGDLAVMHPDGYIEIKDRSKDIVISGGENISTIEVEGVLYRHPAVLEAAVVAKPDAYWGEVPCAFVTLKPGAEASEAEIIAHCRERLARFKAPKAVVFGPLPKTSTGKVQKYVLRERAAQA
jgi:fatty-acyl-CoA synthase